jgi:hypothetical protein
VRRSRGRSRRWQLRQQRVYLLRKHATVEVRELRATKLAQLMHEQARTWWADADPFGLGSVEQPNVLGVHLPLVVLEPYGFGQKLPEVPRGVPVVLNPRVMQQLRGFRNICSHRRSRQRGARAVPRTGS